ncbi:DUF7213 family protein [Mycobacteroides abscessus]
MGQEPGWRVSDFVLMVGFERVQADGTIEHTYGVYEGENQSPLGYTRFSRQRYRTPRTN